MIDRQRLAGTAVEPRGHCFISFIKPCLPSKVFRPPFGPLWVHEIKHDGYRLMVRRDGARVRCFTKSGHDWANRFPAIVDAALRLRARWRASCGPDGAVAPVCADRRL